MGWSGDWRVEYDLKPERRGADLIRDVLERYPSGRGARCARRSSRFPARG